MLVFPQSRHNISSAVKQNTLSGLSNIYVGIVSFTSKQCYPLGQWVGYTLSCLKKNSRAMRCYEAFTNCDLGAGFCLVCWLQSVTTHPLSEIVARYWFTALKQCFESASPCGGLMGFWWPVFKGLTGWAGLLVRGNLPMYLEIWRYFKHWTVWLLLL